LEGQGGSVSSLFLNLAGAGEGKEKVAAQVQITAQADVPKPLLTEPETRFYGAMRRALVDADCRVMAKVNLDDVISTGKLSPKANCKLEKARAKLDRKHVDFVVCRGDSLDVVAVARLDPATRLRPLQRLMQSRVDEVLDEAGIPVVKFPGAVDYKDDEIIASLSKHLG
ncbi:MAG: DUF2726 domain-containing protein, partial [Verrucomicrobiales bacterium]